jgi:hypothetical protein
MPEALRGLIVLRKAHACALQAGVAAWEFAVPLTTMRSQGFDGSDLRLLCALGLADCRIEELTPNTQDRTFRPLTNLAMPDSACLIVTPEGLRYPLDESAPKEPLVGNGSLRPVSTAIGVQAPSWTHGKLWWGDRLVKSPRGHGFCQRQVLSAFEKAGWPRRIDNPLPSDGKVRTKERLRQTIRHLNEGHAIRVLEFCIDEEHRGICWEPV